MAGDQFVGKQGPYQAGREKTAEHIRGGLDLDLPGCGGILDEKV
jgi:hypothetical protein